MMNGRFDPMAEPAPAHPTSGTGAQGNCEYAGETVPGDDRRRAARLALGLGLVDAAPDTTFRRRAFQRVSPRPAGRVHMVVNFASSHLRSESSMKAQVPSLHQFSRTPI
jgi:hypothetical protein